MLELDPTVRPMLNQHSLPYDTSADLEKEAIERFRSINLLIPKQCLVFREPWESTTILCIDFKACPHLLPKTQVKADFILSAAQDLGLSNSIIFRISHKVISWKSFKPA